MEKLKSQAAMTVYVLLGTTGILFSFADTFQIKYGKEKVCLIVMLFCILLTAILSRKTKCNKLIAAGVTVGSIACMAALYGNQLRESLNFIWMNIGLRIEQYFEITITSGGQLGAENADKGLIVLFFLIGSLVSYSVVCIKRDWLAILLLGIGFLIPFFFGKEPENLTVFIIVVTAIGIISCKSSVHFQKEGKRKTGFVSIGIAVSAFLIGMFFPGPQLRQVFKNSEQFQSSVENFWEGNFLEKLKGQGGVNAGIVGGLGELRKDNSRHLRLTMEEQPSADIYLKGYVGVEYQNNRWAKANASVFQNWARTYDTSAQEILNPVNLSSEKISLHIENIGANLKYRYMPYGGNYGTDLKIQGDTYVRGDWIRDYDVTYFPGYHYMVQANDSTFSTGQTNLEKAYSEFVKKEYCDVPEHIEKAFGSTLAQEIPEKNVKSVIKAVGQLLDKTTEYSLHPGVTPQGRDAAEYFYFENKKGYCEHFATTAVLMLRMKGIPARYVAGYKVDAEDFHENKDGNYVVTVTGDSAHAWAEAYIPGAGWVPVETTPAYSGSEELQEEVEKETKPVQNELQNETVQPDEELQTEQVKESEIAEHEGKIGGAEWSGQFDMRKQGHWRYWMIPVGMIFTAAVFLGRNFWIRKKRMKERRTTINERTKIIFQKIYELLVLAKIMKKDQEVNEELIQKLCEACPKVDRAEANRMLEIIYCAAFGNKKIQKEEFKLCQKIYRQVRTEISENISSWRKFWWKYWRGIPL